MYLHPSSTSQPPSKSPYAADATSPIPADDYSPVPSTPPPPSLNPPVLPATHWTAPPPVYSPFPSADRRAARGTSSASRWPRPNGSRACHYANGLSQVRIASHRFGS